ncbi:putative PEP-CTERM system TPR-repeat lipoprotein [Pseudoduganella lurida]|uniref:Putative PEP-CTERM system TPR-repeat lipoprotein n=1 Tax=Pseudoduganella lurida TaxID=1036180 RepID=A0A562R361_9BURK|nr:XrtA/PEP-CTERM system TPR-repeat protein PrsT [Pseudoduganella lurida]TWI62994.1 putative PEP-CTERM system TPR-repeat lipoprotein [Pseudoduganella lurida]
MQRRTRIVRRTFHLTSGLALAALLVTGCGSKDNPDQLLAQARQYEAKGDHRAAIIQLKNALQQRPDDAAARLALGRLYGKTGDQPSAEKELRRALDLGGPRETVLPLLAKSLIAQNQAQAALDLVGAAPATAPLLSLRGDALLALKQFDASRAAYQAALQKEPNHADALNGLARHALLQNDVDGALRLADAAVVHNPADIDALLFRGDLDKAMGRIDAARATYDKALQLNPDAGTAHLQKAYLDIGQKKFDAARADLAALKKVAPRNPLAWHAQALLDFSEGRYQAALGSIQNLLKVAPDYPPAQLLAGAIQFALGSLPQAEQHLKKYLENDAGSVYARKMLASVYLGLKRPDEALGQLKNQLATSTDVALLNIGARAYMTLNRFDQAAVTYQRAVGLAPGDAPAHIGLGLAKMSQGDGAGAIGALRRGVELSPPKSVDAGIVLAMTHLELKQFDPAVAVVQDMLRRAPDNAMLHNLLGGALLGRNDRAGARAAFTRSLQLAPDFFTPAGNLGRMDLADRQPEAARQRFQAFLDRNPASVEALTALAELAQAQNRTADATALLERASAAQPALPGPGLRLAQQYLRVAEPRKALTLVRAMQVASPEDPALLDMLGRVQLANGDRAAALEAYHRMAAIQPRTAGTTARLSAAYEALGERDLAADTLRKAHAERPDDLGIVLARAAVETRRGNYDQAILFAKDVQARPASTVAGLIVEAEIRETQRQPEQAIPLYRKALQLNGDATPVRIKLANACRQAGRPDEALKLVRQWHAERPDDLALGVYLGELYAAQKQYPAAIDTFHALQRRLPDNGVVLNNLALAYQASGDARAQAAAEGALKALPDSPAVLDTLGWILVEQGEVPRGLGLLKQASAADPAAGEIRYHLAAAHARNNDKAAARRELETLLAARGDRSQAEQARALLRRL